LETWGETALNQLPGTVTEAIYIGTEYRYVVHLIQV